MSDNEQLTIRTRMPEDISELLEILKDVYDLTGYPVDGPSTFAAKLQQNTALQSLVALHDGRLAGHVQLQTASSLNSDVIKSLTTHQSIDTYAALVSLFVNPKLQGRGIGLALVQEALAWGCKEEKRLVLIVLEKDPAAIRMYDRLGWERGIEYVYRSIQGRDYRAFVYVAPV